MNLKELFVKELWRKPLKSYSRHQKFVIRQLRIFRLAFKGFNEDKVQLRASALTYYSMLSIVPIVAMAFGIAKGFGFEKWLQSKLLDSFSGQETVLQWILTFVDRYLKNINGGVIAGVGVVMLVWSVIKLLGSIESSFNDIWQIKKSRLISRKLSDYVSLVVIAPILLFVSSSVTVFLSEQLASSSQGLPLIGYIGSFLSIVATFIPYVLIWLVFTLLFIIMPNTKVKFKSALIGGIISGTMFQLLQYGYIHFQSLLTGYGAVYGSFAAMPLFLIWLQTSWLIVLFGAEMGFANQNVEHYEAESESINISNHLKRAISLLIFREIVLNFKNGKPAATAEDMANKLDLPVRLVRDVLYELLEIELISETLTRNVKENAYQPAQDIQRFTVGYVLELLEKRGSNNLHTEHTVNLGEMQMVVDGFLDEIKNSKNNILMQDLAGK
jgi:membrane protein